MSYLTGSGLILAAFLAIPAFRLLFKRTVGRNGGAAFGAAESVALLAIAAAASGLAVIGAAAFADWSWTSGLAAAGAVAGALLAAATVWRLLAAWLDLSEGAAPGSDAPEVRARRAANQNRRRARHAA